ncbi:MAG: hypothetical protein DRQ88_06885 [Epsilonproteobacteria bacterium]|nr:MAG: hypothetical protein DRQ89_05705 [Campylobacterota bacterium]RLA66360.1 MAG: hypothetical protein DRQ88_06885 [Campylobacterota bacterium]
MKKTTLITLYILSFSAFGGDFTGIGGGRSMNFERDMFLNNIYSDDFTGSFGDGSMVGDTIIGKGKSNGDGGGLEGLDNHFNPSIDTTMRDKYLDILSSNREDKRDFHRTLKFWETDKEENGFSGGIIGRLPEIRSVGSRF